MSQVINTNVASLNAQRNLQSSQSSLATSLQRLSSGLRINSAKDDAAGLAISERFTTQIRGINQAIRNANDGISLAQVGESALAEVTSNLQRIRELAVQSANATNSDSDRLALDLEVQQRLQEIDRVASQTSFNGRKLLDGSFGNATFQIGAEAGQSLSLNLGANASTRLSAIGQIAQTATAGAIGAGSTGGTLSLTATSTNFGTTGAAATAGRAVFQLDAVNFGSVDSAGSSGTAQFTAAAFDFRSGSNTRTTIDTAGELNFSGGAAEVAQFDVDGIGITLSQNYSGNVAGLASDIEAQLRAVNDNYRVVANGADFTITNRGSSTAVAITNADANAAAAGITNSAGTAGSAQPLAQFQVDGFQVELTGNSGNATTLASDLQAAIVALGDQSGSGGPNFLNYTVSNSGNVITINNGVNGGDGVVISGANASAVQGGIQNTAGTAGVAATIANNGGFTVDSAGNNVAIVLNQDYGSFTAVRNAIQSQLDSANSGAYAGQYNVSVDQAGQVTIARTTTGAGSAAVTLSAEVVNTAGQSTFSAETSTAGADQVATTNASFLVDGVQVTLNEDYADPDAGGPLTAFDALRSAIGTQLGSGYTVSGSGSDVTITNNAGGSAAVSITNADPNAFNSGFINGAGTAGTVAGSVTLTDFSINGTSVTGTFASADELATQINTSVSGVYATVDNGALRLSSSAELTLGGADRTTLGFADTTVAANTGSLSGSNVQTVTNANAMIQRIDSALTSVSTFRSTFGAIQNRFESVTANLTSSVENLSASRSRILDADFAAETANLTRAQILQQAGVAMLAQANALPQNVLSLLR